MSLREGPIPNVTEFPWFTGKGNDLRIDVNLGRTAGLSGIGHFANLEGNVYYRAEDILAMTVCAGGDPRNNGFTKEQSDWGYAMYERGFLDCGWDPPKWIKSDHAPIPPEPLRPWKSSWGYGSPYVPPPANSTPATSPVRTPGIRPEEPLSIRPVTIDRDPDGLPSIFAGPGRRVAPEAAGVNWGKVAAITGLGLLAMVLLGKKR